MTQEAVSVVDLLVAARELVADPSRWTQGAMARNKEGVSVSASNESAVAWCALGALRHVGTRLEVSHSIHFNALSHLQDYSGGMGVAYVNDKGGDAQVLTMFDEAIQQAKREANDGGGDGGPAQLEAGRQPADGPGVTPLSNEQAENIPVE